MKTLERLLFIFIGIALIVAGFWLWFSKEEYATGLASLVLAFVLFFLSQQTNFKSIKAFGVEAVFWKNKRKEVENLLSLMRSHLKIIAQEILATKTKMGRWDNSTNWMERWQLYDSLLSKGKKLDGKYELKDSKEMMETYSLFDAICPRQEKVQQALNEGMSKIQAKIGEEFGNVIADNEGYEAKISLLRSIQLNQSEDLFQLALEKKFAESVLNHWTLCSQDMKSKFDIVINIEDKVIEDLKSLHELEKSNSIDRNEVMAFIE